MIDSKEKKDNKIVFLILILLALLIGGYFGLKQFGFLGGEILSGKSALEKRVGDIDYEKISSPSNFDYTSEEFSLFGKISTMYNSALSLEDEYGSVQLNMDNATGDELADGDSALVRGEYKDDGYVHVSEAYKLTTDENIQLAKDVLPQMDIEILESPTSFAHGCEHIEFKLRIKNVGKMPVEYSKFFDSNSRWKFGFQIDNEEPMYGYSINDETGGVTADGQGLETFAVMQPGDQEDLAYYGGGNIFRSDLGTGGLGNIFCGSSSNPSGDRTIKFLMGVLKSGSYTEINVGGESKTVTVNAEDCECNLD